MDAAAWQRLAAAPEFWELVERKIVAVANPHRNGVRLSGGSYVGRAVIDGVVLELREKVPDALASLLQYLGHGVLRTARTPSPVSDLNELARAFVGEFLASVRAYLGRGRDRRYVAVPRVGSLVGGRLDMTRTLRLRARGLPHLVGFDRNELTFDTPLNQVVYAALVEAERLDGVLDLSARHLAMARALALALADCRDASVLRLRRESIMRYAQDVAEDIEDEAGRDLALLAGVVLSHESFSTTDLSGRLGPRAWFLNLERLFESAVRSVLAKALVAAGGTASLWHRERVNRRIFKTVGDAFRADPDLVLSVGDSVAVGDVKYKAWDGRPSAPDLYQLLVHAKTYEAGRCFLVFPHDAYAELHLGLSATGCDTWMFAVDVRRLSRDIPRFLKVMDVADATPAASVKAPPALGQQPSEGSGVA